MNTRTRTLIASLCILASGSAVANDAVWGALLGGGAGAAIGGSVSGRNGAIVGGAIGAAAGAVIASDSDHNHADYRPQVVYHPAPPVYYAPPTRVVTPVYCKRLSIGVIAGWSAMRYRSAGGFRRSAASTGAV